MRVATWNVNGLRKREPEVLQWIESEQPDVVCLQEIKALPEQVPAALRDLPDYWSAWHGHKGYSGVALLLRKRTFPEQPRFEHPPFDYETRMVMAEAGGHLFASIYAPNGGKDFAAKMRFLTEMRAWTAELHAAKRSLVVCGDMNVARTDMDVHPTERRLMVGQTPEERFLLEGILGAGLRDVLRDKHATDDRMFTWWAPWRSMRQKNIGWRLDFVIASEALAARAATCDVRTAFGTSDHAPVIADFE